jgi:hypothetical protein
MFGPLLMVLLLLLARPVGATDVRTTGEDVRSPAVNEPAGHMVPTDILRGLFAQALATLQEYVEVETALQPDGSSPPQTGEFRLKLFPQGKSRSQDHFTAEGTYRRSPDAGQREFTLRFKSSGNSPAPPLPPINDDVI